MGWLLQTLIDGWEINRWCPRVPAPVRERVGILVALGPSLWSTSGRSASKVPRLGTLPVIDGVQAYQYHHWQGRGGGVGSHRSDSVSN